MISRPVSILAALLVYLALNDSPRLLQAEPGAGASGIEPLTGQTPDEAVIRKALVIAAAPGYPEFLTISDPIEYSIVHGTWNEPKEGSVVQYNDTSKGIWETMQADSQGWFGHRSLRNGYVYVSIDVAAKEVAILEAMGHVMVYVNGSPRSGNPYRLKEGLEAWEPRFDYSLIPIVLEKGRNHLLFQCARERFKVKWWKPRAAVTLNPRDLTLPDIVKGEKIDAIGGIVIVNASELPLKDLVIASQFPKGLKENRAVGLIQPLSVRKVAFSFKGTAPDSAGAVNLGLSLRRSGQGNGGEYDTCTIPLRVVSVSDTRKETFVSSIDGSVQYYAMNPASVNDPGHRAALVLSLHGASVEGVNQASSYFPKTWAHIVAPTNRRPYGYNWEDWGRIDALEVLELARKKLSIDENRVYLTGHSMGGHGTYHIGALFPDRFAAIGPSAGWISFWSYRVRHTIENPSLRRQMLMRATLASDTYTLAANYAQLGVYILHGSKDDNVLPEQSRSMAAHLAKFQKDFIYHEQEGAGHWWDNSGEPGSDCVDWFPMFDFFARHARPLPERIRQIDFVTPGPGVSASNNWVTVDAQEEQMKLSSVSIRVDPGSRQFVGTTRNVSRLAFRVADLLKPGPLALDLDSQKVAGVPWPGAEGTLWLERRGGIWSVSSSPSPDLKGSHRYGTFKDAIRNRVVFVYGTKGSAEENRWAFEKARFDAERFWYQGNGSIEVLSDADFEPGAEPDRNVVLYGNAATNGAWKSLLAGCPVRAGRGEVAVGDRKFRGADISCLFIRPRPGSATASVGVVAGTGIAGMRLTNKMPYFLPGVGFPDCVVVDSEILKGKEDGLRAVGFFGIDWSVEHGEFAWQGK